MHPEIESLFEEAIKMELNVSDLYFLFHQQLEEDAAFWWELAMEEQNHAALLKTAREMMMTDGVEIPRDLLPENLEALKASNDLVKQLTGEFRKSPARHRAFQLALQIERSAGELHYDHFMHKAPDSAISKVFLKLNGDDMDHASRIQAYMEKHRIPDKDG